MTRRVLIFIALVLANLACAAQTPSDSTSVHFSWIFQSDVTRRIEASPIVASGIVVSTRQSVATRVDGIDVVSHIASIDIDHVFKGAAARGRQSFVWYLPVSGPGGVMYSDPPITSFKVGKRYLLFLRRERQRLAVAMPVYRLEMELSVSPVNDGVDRSASDLARNSQIAQELERATLALPTPQPGTTGDAPVYFRAIIDLIGGCAEPILRRFQSSDSAEIRSEAERDIHFLREKQLSCSDR